MFLRKLGEFDPSKTRSPGRKPEGKAGESGRFPGRLFTHITVSEELVPYLEPAVAQVPGRKPEGYPEGKSEKVAVGSQRARNLDSEAGSSTGCSEHSPLEKLRKIATFLKNTESRKVRKGFPEALPDFFYNLVVFSSFY